ncbi:SDR family NAD(P)-dependent oxidoreductase [Streptomyces sp. ME02-8801-2C]|uniref:SDR family NAD(P)-dependent oxidoreductase n=1 Tax=Streptomyces sp. ME02-8801-2C TaxID=3028680 RepID=UPI0029A999FB|nr:SDR family NAD(P)-dependent oxidoreductase [Streptomyces sp. ME02-8801-2C]MDX3457947.1 SDR family NAD(P)-dependent oxidoreductase [Streptomyces sp. ME02-8801-2C]
MTMRKSRSLDVGSAHAIVTGGSSGIGLATARLLAQRGAKVSLIARGPAVAPGMVAGGRGSVVAVSSAAGLIGVFGYSAYGPAKFAVRGLMEEVRAELTPAWGAPLTAEKVAAAIVAGVERRRFVICPDTGTRAPARFGSVLTPLLNREFDRRARSIAKAAK